MTIPYINAMNTRLEEIKISKNLNISKDHDNDVLEANFQRIFEVNEDSFFNTQCKAFNSYLGSQLKKSLYPCLIEK